MQIHQTWKTVTIYDKYDIFKKYFQTCSFIWKNKLINTSISYRVMIKWKIAKFCNCNTFRCHCRYWAICKTKIQKTLACIYFGCICTPSTNFLNKFITLSFVQWAWFRRCCVKCVRSCVRVWQHCCVVLPVITHLLRIRTSSMVGK